jgi:hypothetical protein
MSPVDDGLLEWGRKFGRGVKGRLKKKFGINNYLHDRRVVTNHVQEITSRKGYLKENCKK